MESDWEAAAGPAIVRRRRLIGCNDLSRSDHELNERRTNRTTGSSPGVAFEDAKLQAYTVLADANMGQSPEDWAQVKTTETTLDILEFLQQNDGADLTTLASDLDLAKSTVHRHLGTLQDRGYVVTENRRYHVSVRFAKLGEHARTRKEEYILAEKMVEELAEETGERVQYIIEEHGYAVYMYIGHGEHAVRTDPGPGSRIPIHTAASGKAILSSLPDQRIEEIIDHHGLPKSTEQTITDEDRLHEELEAIRERGFAYNNEEAIEGLLAIGVPVRGAKERVTGALSISGPSHRIQAKAENELAELLLGAANELELNITYS